MIGSVQRYSENYYENTFISLSCNNSRNETFYKHSVEKAMAPHSSPLAWKIPWMEEPGRLQSMGSQRVGHD